MEQVEPQERWSQVPGYNGRYEASDVGGVRSISPANHRPAMIVLKPVLRKGYSCVRLYLNGKQVFKGVHDLVLLAFKGPDENPKRTDANHKDGNKSNNRLDNLEWATRRENYDHAVRTGLRKSMREVQKLCAGSLPRGSSHFRAKLKESDIPEIRQMLTDGLPPGRIAKIKGVTRGTIRAIDDGKTWLHVP